MGWDFATSDNGWLTDRNTRFLFVLDGFDELLLERGANKDLRQFLEQVEAFQRRCKENSERGHRVLITGRPLALWGIEKLMPHNLERVEIILIKAEILTEWLAKWGVVADPNQQVAQAKAQAFKEFLEDKNFPRQVKELAQEPLLLYLLAAMHRDNALNADQFSEAGGIQSRILVYEKVLNWVLEKQRNEAGQNLNPRLTGFEPEDLRSILAEAALCVTQSGREYASILMIQDRLRAKEDQTALAFLEEAQKNSVENPLKNALAAFYMKSVPGADNAVEFFHKSFGEFLCAERLQESLCDWTLKESKGRKHMYRTSNKVVEEEIYDLLGYGHLTVEIVAYLMALLEKNQVDFVLLFERLNEFYLNWCDGKFIDATEQTIPQKIAIRLQKYDIGLGQRQVDIFVGLNVLILLLTLHKFAQEKEELKDQIRFYPCGQMDTQGKRISNAIDS